MTEKAKVLVVDDDDDVREVVRRVLDRDGYQVLEARTGAEGVKLAVAETPKLILMDISMPDMDGYEATRQINGDPSLASIPVIFITGRSAAEDNGQSFASGAVSYICKPFTAQQLKDVVMLVMLSLAPPQ